MSKVSKQNLLNRIAACDSLLKNILKQPQIPYQREQSEQFAQPVKDERDALLVQLSSFPVNT